MDEQIQNETKKSGRGGARPGSGRPRGRKDCCSITIRLPEDVAEILDKQENRSAYIVEAIRAYHRANSAEEA